MLHAKELRFGNKVLTQNGEIITVQQILGNTLVMIPRSRSVGKWQWPTAPTRQPIPPTLSMW